MQLNGSGTGIESPALTPQEAAQNTFKTLLRRVEKHCTAIARQDRRIVRTIHQLRVDIRRTLAALQLFQDLLPKSEVAWFQKRLKQLRKLSGPVRDRDVLAKRLAKISTNPEIDKLTSHSLRQVVRWIRRHRRQFLKPLEQKAARLHQRGSLAKHHERLLQDLTQEPSVANRDMSPVGAAPDHASMTRRLQVIAQECLQSSDFQIDDLESIHQFRLRIKSFRYAIEILADRLPQEPVSELLSVFSSLQLTLGSINDHRFAWQGLKSLSKDFSKQDQGCLRKLSQDAKQELKSSLKSLRELWTPAFRQQLHDQVEVLVGS